MGILDKLLGSKKKSPPSTISELQSSSDREIATRTTEPVEKLLKDIQGLGHPEYPFLSKIYSPNSRVPCTDFTPFLTERLQANDLDSVIYLVRGLLASNPGLGVGPEWGDEIASDTAKLNFDNFVEFDNPKAIQELKALYIIAGKGGSEKRFLLAEEGTLNYFSMAMGCFLPVWKSDMEALRKRANDFIEEMSKQASFWVDYPSFSANCWAISPPEKNPLVEMLRQLRPLTRVHLFHFISSHGGIGSLLRSTIYSMRSLGIDSADTSEELINMNLCVPTEDHSSILKVWTKSDLIDACEKSGVEYKKSWKKEKIFKGLQDKVPELLSEAIRLEKVMIINPKYQDELFALEGYSRTLQDAFKLLCFL